MIIERWGLDLIGIDKNFLIDIIEPIIGEIVNNRATKPKIEGLYKNLERNKRNLYKAIAAKLLEKETLTPEQLDFILAYAPEIAGKAAPHLFREAYKYKLDHIIEALRLLWIQYGRPTKVECPYCGFRSVTPDLYCIVCGRVVEEQDLKNKINFKKLIKLFAENASLNILQEIIASGFILYDGEIKPPSMRALSPLAVELYLNSNEKKILEEEYRKRISKNQ